MSVKNSGQFGYYQRGKTKSGDTYRKLYITDDIILKKGQSVYLNDLEDSIKNKVKFIKDFDENEARQQLEAIRKRDQEFDRETLCVLRAVEPKQEG